MGIADRSDDLRNPISATKLYVTISCYKSTDCANIAAVLVKHFLAHLQPLVRVALVDASIIKELDRRVIDHIDIIQTPVLEAKVSGLITLNEGSARQMNAILTGVDRAIENSMTHMLFLNSGSWIFSAQGVSSVIEQMNRNVIAFRLAVKGKQIIPDDHFLFFNLQNKEIKNILNVPFSSRIYNPFDFNFNSIHRCISHMINCFSCGNVFVYSNLTECKNISGMPAESLLPFCWDPTRGFLHSNARYPEVQAPRALLLKEMANIENTHIQRYIVRFLPRVDKRSSKQARLLLQGNLSFFDTAGPSRIKRLIFLVKRILFGRPPPSVKAFEFYDVQKVK
jgi:hypothetical protein